MSGFFASGDVRLALLAGSVVAALSALCGCFVIVRGLSFAGHAVTDVGLTGGAAALLLGFDPLAGLLAFSIGAASGVAALGEARRERDVATGLVLAFGFGLGALFLHLQTRGGSGQNALLFGSVFALEPGTVATLAALGLVATAALALAARPLLFASVAPEVARAARLPVRALGFGFLILMAIAVAETAQVVGVLIGTALLIGPAASALRVARTPLGALVLAAAFGVAEVWTGIVLAYASFTWPGGHAWPVSFFVATLALGVYLGCTAASGRRA